MIKIPIEPNGSAHFTLSCNVGKNSVSMRFLWNERDYHWFADFESVDGKNCGVRVIDNSFLLRNDNRVDSSGDFAVLKAETSSTEGIGFDNFGSTYCLYFILNEDKPAFEGLL